MTKPVERINGRDFAGQSIQTSRRVRVLGHPAIRIKLYFILDCLSGRGV